MQNMSVPRGVGWRGVEKHVQVQHLAYIESRDLLPLEKGQEMLFYPGILTNMRQNNIHAWDLGPLDLLKPEPGA